MPRKRKPTDASADGQGSLLSPFAIDGSPLPPLLPLASDALEAVPHPSPDPSPDLNPNPNLNPDPSSVPHPEPALVADALPPPLPRAQKSSPRSSKLPKPRPRKSNRVTPAQPSEPGIDPLLMTNSSIEATPLPLDNPVLPVEDASLEELIIESTARPESASDWLETSPDLFPNGKTTTRMASALPIWEASSILTQRKDLPWNIDPKGKLRYSRNVENGEGVVHFWVTENTEEETPATLAGAAALAVIDTFDIRAACMHLIYAAHATQIDCPWEQEFVISDRQIEEYLGLKKRTDKNKQQKLALIQEIAKQPCKITTFVSWPTQNKMKGFTVEEGRLWHLLGMRYHYQHDLFGNKELSGITFIVRAGLWARYFLNEEGRKNKNALCEYSTLSKSSLLDVMSVWQHREGAARLMVWLLFKTRSERQTPLPVKTLMEVAYGPERIEQAQEDSYSRKKFVSLWDDTLHLLHDRGWCINFDPETYPPELQPWGFGRSQTARPRGFFEQLLNAHVWITPQDDWSEAAVLVEEEPLEPRSYLVPEGMGEMTGDRVKSLRIERGWSQRKLAALTGLSQGLISQIETGGRSLTPDNEDILGRVFFLDEQDTDTDLTVG